MPYTPRERLVLSQFSELGVVVIRILAVVVLMLAACTSGAERDEATCDSYGFTRGTNEYADCVTRLESQRRQEIGPRSSY